MASHWKCVRTVRPVIMLLALVLPILEAGVGKCNCISNFPELEEEFLKRKQNLDSLNEAFFPPNRQLSIVVDVYFYFLSNISSPSEGSTLEDDSIDEDDQPNLERLELEYYDYKFRWAASSVVTFIGPDLLQVVSLHTFFDSTRTAKVIIPAICGSLELDKKHLISTNGHSSQRCSNRAVGQAEKLLNRLTTLLKSYVVNKAVTSEEYRGYSSYYFHHNYSRNSCVIGYARGYKSAQFALTIVLISFILVLSFGTPGAIRSVHNTLYKRTESRKEKRKNKPWKTGESNLQYYIWATVIVAVCLDAVIIGYDALVLVFADHVILKGTWDTFFILAVVGFFVFLAIDVVVCLIYSNSLEAIEKDFLFPHCCFSHCYSSNNEEMCHWRAVGWLRRAAGILAVMVALQLLFFHGVYMFLGFIASPLSSATIIIFYFTTIFCAVIFLAILLKFFTFCCFNCNQRPQRNQLLEEAEQFTPEIEQSHHESRREQSHTVYIGGLAVCIRTAPEQGLSHSNSVSQSSTSASVRVERGQRSSELQQCKIEKCKSILQNVGSIVIGFLMLTFVVCFGAFIFINGTLVIEHNNAGGFLGFVGALAPSAFLTLVGYCGKRFLDVGSTQRNVDAEQAGQTVKQKPIQIIVAPQVPSQTEFPLQPSSQPPVQTSILQSTVDDTESPLVVSIEPETRLVPEVMPMLASQEDFQIQHSASDASDRTSQDQMPSIPEDRRMATPNRHSQNRRHVSSTSTWSNSEPWRREAEVVPTLSYQQAYPLQQLPPQSPLKTSIQALEPNSGPQTREFEDVPLLSYQQETPRPRYYSDSLNGQSNRHSQSKRRTKSMKEKAHTLNTPLLHDQ